VVKTHVEESLGANPGDAALNPADSVAMGVPSARAPRFLDSSRGRAFRALRHREYGLLFSAFLINQTGFWISHVSMQGLMVQLTGNDPFQIGLLFFFLFIPAFLLAPLAGVAADRFDRKRIVLACYAGVVAVTSSLAWLTNADLMTPQLLLGLSLLMGTAFAFSGPSNFAIAANSVPEEDLPSAVSLQSAANNLTRVVGPAAAAPLVAGHYTAVSFAIFAVAAASAGLLISRIRLSSYERDTEDSGIIGRMRNGFEHARERKPALPALFTVAVLSLFGVSHMALVPVFADVALGDRDLFAWIVVATGSGALVGAIVTGYTNQSSLRVAGIQVAVYGVALAVFATSTDFRVALAAQVVIGYFYFSVMTSLQTLVQQVVDDSKRGRVMSLFQVCWAGLVPFGGLGMGAAGDSFGVVATLLVAGSVCTLYGVILIVRNRN
jgi:MFS family permease